MVTITDIIGLVYGIYWSTVILTVDKLKMVTIADIIELIYGILVYRNTYN
jgi:hypothetical protein